MLVKQGSVALIFLNRIFIVHTVFNKEKAHIALIRGHFVQLTFGLIQEPSVPQPAEQFKNM